MLEAYTLPALTLVLLAAFQWQRVLIKESPNAFHGATVLLVVSGGMLIDRLILSAGLLLEEGPLLAALSLGRLWLLTLLSPLLIVTYMEYTGRLRVRGAGSKRVAGVVWALAIVLVLVQAWDSLPRLQLENLVFMQEGGLSYYTTAERLLHPGTAAATTLGVISGVFILFRSGWPFVLLAAAMLWIEMLVYPQPFPAANTVEVLWLLALILTEMKVQQEGLQITRSELDSRLDQLG